MRGAAPADEQEVGQMAESSRTNESAAKAAKAATEAAEAYAETAKEGFEAFDMTVPEAFRSAAETAVTQSREAYERSRDAVEGTVEMLEKSFDRAGQGSAALNRRVIDMVQANVNSSFDLARELAGARNVGEVFERQAAFARKQFETFAAQAQEIQEISTKVATEATEPFRTHMKRSAESLRTQ